VTVLLSDSTLLDEGVIDTVQLSPGINASILGWSTRSTPSGNVTELQVSLVPSSDQFVSSWSGSYQSIRLISFEGTTVGVCGAETNSRFRACDVCQIESRLYVLDVCAENQWEEAGTGACRACPEGGCCPGGSRVWAQPGFWNPDENTEPKRCAAGKLACPYGSLTAPCSEPAGAAPPQLCAQGYLPPYCSACANGYYKQFEVVCRSCSAGASSGEQQFLILLEVFVLGGMFVGSSFLSDRNLDRMMVWLFKAQMVTQLGLSSVSQLPDWCKNLSYLAILNLDLNALRPECWAWQSDSDVQTLESSWVFKLFFGCLVAMLCSAAAMTAIAYVRAWYKARQLALLTQNTKKRLGWENFRVRAVRVLVVVLYVWYQRMCIMTMSVMYCPDGRLGRDPTFECYTKAHLPSLFFAYVVLFVYVVGFPVAAVYIASKQQESNNFKTSSSVDYQAKWGFLTRDLRPGMKYYRCIFFAEACMVSVSSVVLSSTPSYTLVTSFFFFSSKFVFVLMFQPFTSTKESAITKLTGLANLAYIIFLLSSVYSNNQQVDEAVVVLVLLMVLQLVLFYRFRPSSPHSLVSSMRHCISSLGSCWRRLSSQGSRLRSRISEGSKKSPGQVELELGNTSGRVELEPVTVTE